MSEKAFHEALEKCGNCHSKKVNFIKTMGNTTQGMIDVYICMSCRKINYKGKAIKKGFWVSIFPQSDRTIDDYYAGFGTFFFQKK